MGMNANRDCGRGHGCSALDQWMCERIARENRLCAFATWGRGGGEMLRNSSSRRLHKSSIAGLPTNELWRTLCNAMQCNAMVQSISVEDGEDAMSCLKGGGSSSSRMHFATTATDYRDFKRWKNALCAPADCGNFSAVHLIASVER